ncbi:uncharacterized protein L969DRAFT_50247 [Mixia osmundae IAM 14324]|uniref:Zn(2)-C6 fungal-type domain-containing protein n=1 Tax=Mixia osmundae (strain CBS 9802 / IAM 14324 / JCM 22182 / KY 12970) TaxID=764103 RepID=G7E167_MIXOS|nr:uncharacterized protein L969DRAFT_50247 [Mixia osmundae IAM 14324]KEI38785.1 hypothetical protein L969DRAFT_50247 [Mixia osmundae IAM 14324]GAA96577.1 hypothetical protein E5Q_03246 [Mixia osmundae IAM 14324]
MAPWQSTAAAVGAEAYAEDSRKAVYAHQQPPIDRAAVSRPGYATTSVQDQVAMPYDQVRQAYAHQPPPTGFPPHEQAGPSGAQQQQHNIWPNHRLMNSPPPEHRYLPAQPDGQVNGQQRRRYTNGSEQGFAPAPDARMALPPLLSLQQQQPQLLPPPPAYYPAQPYMHESQPQASTSAGSPRHSKADERKRLKTPRACDSCRRKKIRCDVLADGEEGQMCVHCKQHRLECSWFLPISETRHKRRKQDSDAHTPARADHNGSGSDHSRSPSQYKDDSRTIDEPRIYGSSSIGHLMCADAQFPNEKVSFWVKDHQQTFEASATGSGLIKLVPVSSQAEEPRKMPQPPHGKLSTAGSITSDELQGLVNSFFARRLTIYPVVTANELTNADVPVPSLLLHCIAGVSALSHSAAPHLIVNIRQILASIFRKDDLAAHHNIPTIQALLIYTQAYQLSTDITCGRAWVILGGIIRMAQSMGMHRESERQETSDPEHLNARRRLWACCVIADAWMSAVFGLPACIDIAMCDCLYPTPVDTTATIPGEGEPEDSTVPLTRLSILLSRVLKLLYSPSGFINVTDEDCTSLQRDLQTWRQNLPSNMQYRHDIAQDSLHAGFLQLCYIPVQFLFMRPFLSIGQPAQKLAFTVSEESYHQLVAWAAQSITWASHNEAIIESWFFALYSFFICSLLQYHTFVRCSDPAALASLKEARDLMARVHSDEAFSRSSVSTVISLLYSTAVSADQWKNAPRAPTPAHSQTDDLTASGSVASLPETLAETSPKQLAVDTSAVTSALLQAPHGSTAPSSADPTTPSLFLPVGQSPGKYDFAFAPSQLLDFDQWSNFFAAPAPSADEADRSM